MYFKDFEDFRIHDEYQSLSKAMRIEKKINSENTCLYCGGTGFIKEWNQVLKKIEKISCQNCMGTGETISIIQEE